MVKSAFIIYATILLSCNQATEHKVQSYNATPIIDSRKHINLLVLDKLKKADSILLISHIGNTFDTKKGEILPLLLIKGRINKSIVVERILLSAKASDSLAAILTLPTNYDSITRYMCFDPHHTIFIYTNNKISYIDLCFQCWGLRSSEDLGGIFGYEEYKWKKVASFFKRLGFKYEMPP